MLFEVGDHLRPFGPKHFVIRARRHRQVELGATRGALAGLLATARSRVEVAAVLVDVGENDVGIVFERVKHPVAVMGIDVDVGDLLQPVALAEQLNRHSAIVEHAEPRSLVARGVMKARNGHEGVARSAAHDGVRRVERGAHNV